ncbi:class I SAM-dependent methyltransferase [Candidatus Omnitrophota bacterium]
MVYLNPRPAKNEILKQYTAEYHVETLLGKKLESQGEIEAQIRKFDIRAEELTEKFGPGKSLLDIGCSAGFFMASLKKYGWAVSGLDVTEWAVKFARDRLSLDARVGTVEDISFDKKFDVITLFQILEHYFDPVGSLKKMIGLLREGGTLVIKGPNLASFDRVWHGKKWLGFHTPYHLYYFTPETYRMMLEKAGFSVEGMVFQYWNPVVHLMEMGLGDGARADHCPDDVVKFDKSRIEIHPAFKALNRAWGVAAHVLNLKGRDVIIYAKKKGGR